MAIIVKDSGGGDFKMVPPGTHIARCYRLLDIGTQEIVWEGTTKLQLKLRIGWELFGEDDEGNPLETDDGMPLTINKTYTQSLGKKARLRQDLEAWRGAQFTDAELNGFDMDKLLGKYCLLTVIHNETGGKTYANVAALASIPNAMKKSLPAGVHELQSFSVLDPDMAIYETFHDKLKETVQKSLEWRNKHGSGGFDVNKELAVAGGVADLDSDIPF